MPRNRKSRVQRELSFARVARDYNFQAVARRQRFDFKATPALKLGATCVVTTGVGEEEGN